MSIQTRTCYALLGGLTFDGAEQQFPYPLALVVMWPEEYAFEDCIDERLRLLGLCRADSIALPSSDCNEDLIPADMARQANALKALHKELDDITEDNKAGLTLKLGRESFTLESGEYLGAAVGTEFAYVVQGKTTSVLALDRSKKTATILSDAQVTAKAADIRKDMLPEPEPPQDLLDALEKLRGSGWTVTVDAKGNPTLVPVGAGSTPRATRQRAPKGQGKPKAEPKPKFARGLKLQRVKDNAVYVIQSVDEAAKKMNLKADGGKETIEISIAPIQWKYWRVAP